MSAFVEAGPAGQTLQRLLDPRSIAVIGISEGSGFADSVRRSLAADAEFFFVHPRAERVFGHATYPDLASVGRPVDAVFSVVAAERTVDVVRDAVRIGAGGVVTVAGGYAESGPEGLRLQQAMAEHALAANMPVIGPNGVGMVNVPRKLDLCILADFARRPGGLSVAMHSGAMIEALAASAWRAGGVGFNLMVSAGNEAVTDIADYLNHFAADDATRVIALVIETIRRPDAFFSAAARCLQAGKPIVALKLGRSERSQRMAASHTGTLTGDAWVYDVAFEQAGIQRADDIDDLVDRVQFLEQLPPRRWTPVKGLAVLTGTGGFAQLASDLASEESVDIPEAVALRPFVESMIPGCTIANPLDATGFINGSDDRWSRIVGEFVNSGHFDTYLFAGQHADWDRGEPMAKPFVAAGRDGDGAFVIAPLAGHAGSWLDPYRSAEVAVGNGLRGSLRGISTMARFMRKRRNARVNSAADVPALHRPHARALRQSGGQLFPFDATMRLLALAGIPTAPYHLIDEGSPPVLPPFDGPFVVKLADLAHRTEHGAVRLDVSAADLAQAVVELRDLAVGQGLPSNIAVQPMVYGHGEAFIGLRGSTELGPVVAFGLGGVFVEVLGRVGGRMAPMSERDAAELLAEFDDLGVLQGFRGGREWDRSALVEVLTAAGRLAAAGRDWIESIDVNPLIVTDTGLVAVDGACFVR